MKKIIPLLLMCVAALSACQPTPIYSKFHTVPTSGWNQDSILTYDVEVEDSTTIYEVLIVVRHNMRYPYQNLWLFVDEFEKNMCIRRDTIEATLADNYGRWLGKGNNRFTLLLMYNSSCRFKLTGNYTFNIQHGMRTERLEGITDIGLIIRKNNEQE